MLCLLITEDDIDKGNLEKVRTSIAKKGQLETKLKKAKQIQLQIESKSKEITKYKEQLHKAESELEKLYQSPDYLDEIQIEKMQENLSEIQAIIETMRSFAFDVDFECVVCLETQPEEVHSCDVCDNWICGNCKDKVKTCPTCRADLKDNPLRRNKTVERIVRK